MRILVKPNICLGTDFLTEAERSLWISALKFPHTNPSKQQRENPYWDGMVSFWLDPNQQKFPTGFLPHVLNFLYSSGVYPDIVFVESIEKDAIQVEPDVCQGVTLRSYQIEAVNTAIKHNRGIVTAPPRSGKTLIQAALAATLNRKSVIFVEKDALVQQHYKNLTDWGLDPGIVQGSRRDFHKKHVIAMLQTVNRHITDPAMQDWLKSLKVMQIDECHHAAAESYYRAALHCAASWRIGYSGTPFSITDLESKKFNEDTWRLCGLFGNPIFAVTVDQLREMNLMVPVDIIQVKRKSPDIREIDGNDWHKVYTTGIAECAERDEDIVKLATALVAKDFKPLVLVKYVGHGERLLSAMSNAGLSPLFAKGGKNILEVTGGSVVTSGGSVIDAYSRMLAGSGNILIATQIGDEGVDFPHIDALILAVGGKSDQVTTQRLFRPLTAVAGKHRAIVFDFDDDTHGVLKRQSALRRRIYKLLGFHCHVLPIEQAVGMVR